MSISSTASLATGRGQKLYCAGFSLFSFPASSVTFANSSFSINHRHFSSSRSSPPFPFSRSIFLKKKERELRRQFSSKTGQESELKEEEKKEETVLTEQDTDVSNTKDNTDISGSSSSFSSPSSSSSSTDSSSDPSPLLPVKEIQKGPTKTLSFQAETKQILDIVAHSLYTDKEVFLRELISNASDALEKARYLQTNNETLIDQDKPFEIRIQLDEKANTLTIQDYGIGMNEEELQSNLGVIARSGSKAFLKDLKGGNANIIGQFGVGFYSTFMVADKVEVYTTSAVGKGETSYYWSSNGGGTYELSTCERVVRGTKVVLHLKPDMKDYSSKHTVESIIKKYSNFVGFPLYLNDVKINTIGAIWLQSKDSVTDQQHVEFYKYYCNAYDTPTYRLHFSIDAPLDVKALFYFPERHMEKYGMGRMEPGVSVYSRKVLIQPKSKFILPDWLRFVKGVVDSEDLPLNISRENMQDSKLIKRLNSILTRKIIRFLDEESKADRLKYAGFYHEYAQFIKEGVCADFENKKEIAKLVRFDSSLDPVPKSNSKGDKKEDESGVRILHSLDEYISRMTPDQKNIYYLSAPNRSLALASPYFESFSSKGTEVLFLYQPIDDFVVRNLGEYHGRPLTSLESEFNEDEKEEKKEDQEKKDTISSEEEKLLLEFLQESLNSQISSVKSSTRLSSSPALIVNHESASFRKMMRFVDQHDFADLPLPKQKLEINMKHPLIQKLAKQVKSGNKKVAALVAEQLFDNACMAANLLDNPQNMIGRLNQLMEQALEGGNEKGEELFKEKTGEFLDLSSTTATEAQSQQKILDVKD